MGYYDFLSIVFSPLLNMNPFFALLILSIFISIVTTLVTKYATKQELMKKLKDDIKGFQKQMKEVRDNPAKMMEMNKKAMEANMQYMAQSFKATLITSIPIIFLLIPWMNSVFAYESIHPNQEFTVTAFFDKDFNSQVALNVPEGISVMENKTKIAEDGKINWTIKAKDEGDYLLEFTHEDEKIQKNVLVTNGNRYAEAVKKFDGAIKSVQVNYKKLTVMPIGYRGWFGWLGTYIILSLIFTMSLRKFMKVY